MCKIVLLANGFVWKCASHLGNGDHPIFFCFKNIANINKLTQTVGQRPPESWPRRVHRHIRLCSTRKEFVRWTRRVILKLLAKGYNGHRLKKICENQLHKVRYRYGMKTVEGIQKQIWDQIIIWSRVSFSHNEHSKGIATTLTSDHFNTATKQTT